MGTHSIDFAPRMLYEALGYKNIEVDSIVFAEQIKNSCDAKAKRIILDFSNYDGDEISILDDGVGMNESELKENWLLVGTESKVSNETSLGGKGIGRFSLFRVANSITIISKKSNCLEYELTLNKSDLEKLDYINDFEIEIKENKISKAFKNKSDCGTKIILKSLANIDFLEIFHDLYNLVQPDYIDKLATKIEYIYPDFFKKPEIMDINEAVKYAPFYCKATFKGNYIIDYDFKCIVNNNKLYENKSTQDLSQFFSKLPSIDLGCISFYLCNYYFDSTFTSSVNIPKDDIQDSFLNIYQGISIYREKFKIYGHGKTDWLKLAEQRVNAPSKKIDNRLSFGYIVLERPNSDLLEEKTSREGFLKGNELDYFTSAINLIINIFNQDRINSIDIIRKNNFAKLTELMQNDKNLNDNEIEPSNDIQTTEKGRKKSNSDIKTTIEPKDGKNNNSSNTGENNYSSETILGKGKPTINPTPPKPAYCREKIIDSSFICPDTAPEKIKRIIYELQTLGNTEKQPTLYSQALLIRCLIDISTQYAQEKLNIDISKNDLFSNIRKVIDHISNKKLLSSKDKHIAEIRNILRKEETIKYFNGIAHDYDYKTHFIDIKRVWDKFEFYIEFCIKQ